MLLSNLLTLLLTNILAGYAYVHTPQFHYTLGDVAGTPQPYPYYVDDTLHIVHFDTPDTVNYSEVSTYDFTTYDYEGRLAFLPVGAKVTSIVHDDENRSGRFASPGTGNIYLSYIDDSQQGSFLISTNYGKNWTKPCSGDCVSGDVGGASVSWDERTSLFYTISSEFKVATSPDLKSWSTGELYIFDGVEHELFLILPDDDANSPKWVFLSKPETGIQRFLYYIGTMAGQTFAPESGPFVLDYGNDTRDIQAANDGDAVKNRKILTGCLTSEYYFYQPVDIWGDIFYNPREVALKKIDGEYHLVQSPLKRNPFRVRDYSTKVINVVVDGPNPLAAIRSKSFRIKGDFYAGASVPLFGIAVLKQGSAQKTVVGFEPFVGDFFLDRIFSGYPPNVNTSNYVEYSKIYRAPYKPFQIPVKIDVVVDSSTVEAFCNEGEIVFSVVVFPDYYSDEMELYSSVGDTIVQNFFLQVYD